MLRRAALALVLTGGLLAAPAVAGEELPAPASGASQGAGVPLPDLDEEPDPEPSATPVVELQLSPTDPVAEPAAAVGDPVDRLVRWALALAGLLGLAGAAGLYWTRETR